MRLRNYLLNQVVQCTLKDGQRQLYRFTVEQLCRSDEGIYSGVIYHNNQIVNVRRLKSGEWMPIDANGNRITWYRAEFDEWFEQHHARKNRYNGDNHYAND